LSTQETLKSLAIVSQGSQTSQDAAHLDEAQPRALFEKNPIRRSVGLASLGAVTISAPIAAPQQNLNVLFIMADVSMCGVLLTPECGESAKYCFSC
jgi:hypothetical protein